MSHVRRVYHLAATRFSQKQQMPLLCADHCVQGDPVIKSGQRALVRHGQCQQVQIGDLAAATHRHATIMGSKGTVETEYLNYTRTPDHTNTLDHTTVQPNHPWGYLQSQMRVRRGTANSVPFEEITSATGSAFMFAAEAFANVVTNKVFAAIERAASASLDIAATLAAIARSARTGQAVDVVIA